MSKNKEDQVSEGFFLVRSCAGHYFDLTDNLRVGLNPGFHLQVTTGNHTQE